MMRFEITVMRAEGKDSPLVMMDRCTLEAESTSDAARKYADLFAGDNYHLSPYRDCQACKTHGISRNDHDGIMGVAAMLRRERLYWEGKT